MEILHVFDIFWLSINSAWGPKMFVIWLKKDSIAPKEYFDFGESNNIPIENSIRFLAISESNLAKTLRPEIKSEERLWTILEIMALSRLQSTDNSTKYL